MGQVNVVCLVLALSLQVLAHEVDDLLVFPVYGYNSVMLGHLVHDCPHVAVIGCRMGGSPGRVMVHTFMEGTPEEMSSLIWAMCSGGLTPLKTQ